MGRQCPLDALYPEIRACLYHLIGCLEGQLVVVDEGVSGMQLDLNRWVKLGQLGCGGGCWCHTDDVAGRRSLSTVGRRFGG